MSDDQFTKLFKYMNERFDKLEVQLATKANASQLNRALDALDGILARLDTDDTERVMLGRQMNRHEGWIKQLAKKTETKLSYK